MNQLTATAITILSILFWMVSLFMFKGEIGVTLGEFSFDNLKNAIFTGALVAIGSLIFSVALSASLVYLLIFVFKFICEE